MKRTLFGFLCLGLASPVVTSCREVQGTEVLIEVYTNRFAVEEITSVELEIIGVGSDQNPRDDRRCLHRETIELDAANAEGGFEFLFSVRPGDHCNDRVYAKATLYSGNYPLATGAGWQYFEEGSSHRLQISFLNTIECDTSSLWCDDECSEGQQSLEHCGWCGNECPEGARCDRGWCDCPDGGIDCDGKCTDTSKDWRNCGECWNECGPDEACVGGSCTSECPAGRDRCGHDCVDFQTNPEHCGGCGTPCIGICSGGTCDTGCVPRNGGICDPIEQCGCSAGQRCNAISEVQPYGPEHCVPAGTAGEEEWCDTGGSCAAGLTCVSGMDAVYRPPAFGSYGTCHRWCVVDEPATCPHTESGGGCAAVSVAWPYGVCLPFARPEVCNRVDDDLNGIPDDVVTGDDPNNCGACGNACGAEQVCWMGRCLDSCEEAGASVHPCEENCLYGPCRPSCIDTDWNRNHCGRCDAACPNDTETCRDGVCVRGDVGDACMWDTNCSAVSITGDELCLLDLFEVGYTVPGGYCTRFCDLPLNGCPVGSACVDPTGPGDPMTGICLKTCEDSSECRTSQGYECRPIGTTGLTSVCLPPFAIDELESGG